MKVELTTFANKYYQRSINRIKKQAVESCFIDSVSTFNEDMLTYDFKEKNENILKVHIRGFGYWSWKPNIIKQALRKSNADFLIYIDSGFHINKNGRKRFFEYLNDLENSNKNFAVFTGEKSNRPDISNSFDQQMYDKYYTKEYMINKLEIPKSILNTHTVTAGLIIMKNNNKVIRFMEEWEELMLSDINLINDSSNSSSEYGFIGHRHDQSIFSYLIKKSDDYIPFSSDEYNWFEKVNKKANWKKLNFYPFHAKRDLKKYIHHKIINLFMKLKK